MELNNSKRRRQEKIRQRCATMDEAIEHEIAKVEQALETCHVDEREQLRALLRRLQQVLAMEPEL